MTFEELQEASQQPLVPPQLLIEALMVRVALKENPEKINTAIFRYRGENSNSLTLKITKTTSCWSSI